MTRELVLLGTAALLAFAVTMTHRDLDSPMSLVCGMLALGAWLLLYDALRAR